MIPEQPRSCCRFNVCGKVQGVFFRASTREQALRLGLNGWVRNLSNGDVELLACGDTEKIEVLDSWLRHGPRHADVTEVRAEVMPVAEDIPAGFEIRRDG